MGVKVGETRCPGCGAMVPFEEGQRQATCEYCGSSVTLENDDERVVRNVDEADLKRAETERLIRLKELELKEREQERTARSKPLKIAATILLLVIMAICFIVGFSSYVGRTGFLFVGLIALYVLLFMWIGAMGKGK